MKAVLANSSGKVSYQDVPRPTAGPGELLIQIHAAGVNPADGYMAAGGSGKVLGFDVAGVVERVGAAVTRFKPGDEVYAMINPGYQGSFAEWTVCQESFAARKPQTLSFVEAAALPVAALTAYQALFTHGGLQAGQKVLIHGASGGVGNMAVQLARWKRAFVAATTSTANVEFVRQSGAEQVIDYTSNPFEEKVSALDLVMDTVGGETLNRSYRVLREGGTLVSTVSQTTIPSYGHLRAVGFQVQPSGEQLDLVTRLVEEGALQVHVSHIFPLAEAESALQQVGSRHTRGKIVLQITQPAG